MNLTDARVLASPATKTLILARLEAQQSTYTDAVRAVFWPRRRPEPINLMLCSSCEGGDHSLCVCRLATGSWRPVAICACLCRFADQGLPIIDHKRANA